MDESRAREGNRACGRGGRERRKTAGLRHLAEVAAALLGRVPPVVASLRERSHSGSGSMLERLPAWIKAEDNRAEVLAAIRELRAQV